MIELEKTYLAKYLPDLEGCKVKEIFDIYVPREERHPTLRIRKNGDKYEITKKTPTGDDFSRLKEETIPLNEKEFRSMTHSDGKKLRKFRYLFPYKGRIAEIDVYQDALKGLVVIDFEFENEEEKNNFKIPDFCLVDVTQEEALAGGMLCGKSYQDIQEALNRYGYNKIE